MKWTDWVTLAIALLGAALGVLNFLQSRRDRATRIKVTPTWSIGVGFMGLGIDVQNNSSFPVMIREVGLTLGKPEGSVPRRMRIPDERIVSGRQGPFKVDARDTASIVFHCDGFEAYEITKAYAITGDGKLFLGTSGALEQFIANGRRPI